MNREIKFRAWVVRPDCPQGKFVYSADSDPEYMLNLSGDLVWVGNWEGRRATHVFARVSCSVHLLEQFTGLLDKNGKEIYEGDIYLFFSGETFLVAWDQIRAAFALRTALPGDVVGWWPFSEQGPCGEVIGNIHENPELLKEKA